MDKSDTFFLPKMERLIEGLPGTEFAPSYVFHTNRSSSSQGKQELILEAKIRLQKQQKKKREKAIRAAKLSEAKSKLENEKGVKRKLNEQLATDRRREKEEEDTGRAHTRAPRDPREPLPPPQPIHARAARALRRRGSRVRATTQRVHAPAALIDPILRSDGRRRHRTHRRAPRH